MLERAETHIFDGGSNMTARRLASIIGTISVWVGLAPAYAYGSQSSDQAPSVTTEVANAYLPDSTSPFGRVQISNDEAKNISMPTLSYKSDGTEIGNFDKYFYFHRADTDFATAYADLVECDGYARGLTSSIRYNEVPYPYTSTVAGAVGGAIGTAMAQAIFGSAEKRRTRRINMRACMNYKGYDRFGITKDLWEKFNFEEGLSGLNAERRDGFLRQQALVASAGVPQGEALGL